MYSAVMTGVAIGAILAPIAKAWIDGHYKDKQEARNAEQHQLAIQRKDKINKHQKIENVNNRIINVLYSYSKYTSNLVYAPKTADRDVQSKYFGMAMLYMDQEASQKAIDLQREIINYFKGTGLNDPLFQAQSKFNDLVPLIRYTIDQLQAELKQS